MNNYTFHKARPGRVQTLITISFALALLSTLQIVHVQNMVVLYEYVRIYLVVGCSGCARTAHVQFHSMLLGYRN